MDRYRVNEVVLFALSVVAVFVLTALFGLWMQSAARATLEATAGRHIRHALGLPDATPFVWGRPYQTSVRTGIVLLDQDDHPVGRIEYGTTAAHAELVVGEEHLLSVREGWLGRRYTLRTAHGEALYTHRSRHLLRPHRDHIEPTAGSRGDRARGVTRHYGLGRDPRATVRDARSGDVVARLYELQAAGAPVLTIDGPIDPRLQAFLICQR